MTHATPTERNSLMLAALLHDIGKLGQRANGFLEGLSPSNVAMQAQLCPTFNGRPTHLHVLYTREFFDRCVGVSPGSFDVTLAAECAASHHRPDTNHPLHRLLVRADHLASGMERVPAAAEDAEPAHRPMRTTRLASILHAVRLGAGELPSAAEFVHRIAPLADDLDVLFARRPDDPALGAAPGEDLTSHYAALWEGLIDRWRANAVVDPLGYLDQGLNDLEAFTWCVPSATNARPDISLVDHLKATAALAACLYDVQVDDPQTAEPFLLVKGDFGGIQHYLFDLHPGPGGLARRLRGRSFFVAVLTELAARHILRRLGLSLANRIMSGGGNFLLLLPNLVSVHASLDALQRDVDRWSIEATGGEVRLHLARAACGDADIREFPRALARIGRAFADVKARPLASWLIDAGRWLDDRPLLAPIRRAPDQALCDSCRKLMGDVRVDPDRGRDVALCPACRRAAEDGRRLTQTSRIRLSTQPDGPGSAPLGQYDVAVEDGSPFVVEHELTLVPLAPAAGGRVPVTRWLYARHIPRGPDGQALDFEDLAARARGNPLLGYLKADVDNLGLVFEAGLRPSAEGGPDLTSISRLATLSRSLDLFFAGWLHQAIERDFPDLYIVFSGGDDLLVIGPWNQVFDFALHVRRRFDALTGHNPDLTISAGLALARAHVPVLRAVEAADAQLDRAKAAGEGGRKDRVAALGDALPWATFEAWLGDAKRLADWLDADVVSSGQVRRLLRYSRLHRDWCTRGDTRHLRYLSMLIWDLRRNWTPAPGDPNGEAKEAALEWVHGFTNPESPRAQSMSFVCQYAIHAVRQRLEELPNQP